MSLCVCEGWSTGSESVQLVGESIWILLFADRYKMFYFAVHLYIYRVLFFICANFDPKSFQIKRGLVCTVAYCVKSAVFYYIFLFECEMPGLLDLYSRTKMLKFRKSQALLYLI